MHRSYMQEHGQLERRHRQERVSQDQRQSQELKEEERRHLAGAEGAGEAAPPGAGLAGAEPQRVTESTYSSGFAVAYPAHGHSGHDLYLWLQGAHAVCGGMIAFDSNVIKRKLSNPQKPCATRHPKKAPHQPVAALLRPEMMALHPMMAPLRPVTALIWPVMAPLRPVTALIWPATAPV